MFKKLKNIETAFRDHRRFTMVIICGCFITVCFTAWQCCRMVIKADQKVYILSGNQTFSANISSRKENLPVEARGHVRMFHEAFFTLDPDEKVIREHKLKWMYLADNSAKNLDDSLTMAGYYANVIAGNISQRIRVDSVKLVQQGDPVKFRCYATLDIIRSTSTVTRSLVTEGSLRQVERSDHDLQGFLIQNWHIIENKDIQVINR